MPQVRTADKVQFEVDPNFKLQVDVAVARKRSTLRREGILAFSKHFGIELPTDFLPESPEESEADNAA